MANNLNGHLDRLERFGRIISAFGVPIFCVVFLALYLGWLPSPLSDDTHMMAQLLARHDAHVRTIIAERIKQDQKLVDTLSRITDVLKLIDCGQITDRAIRERCLQR